MKATGIIRPVDGLGRVVIPIELRRTLDIQQDDQLEIYVDKGSILFKKYQPACIFCGSEEGIKEIEKKSICCRCIDAIKEL